CPAWNVRFGSEADICSPKRRVRFTPESGHVQRTRGAAGIANVGFLSAIGPKQTALRCSVHTTHSDIPTRTRQAGHKTVPNRIGDDYKYDWDRPRFSLKRGGHGGSLRNRLQGDQFFWQNSVHD